MHEEVCQAFRKSYPAVWYTSRTSISDSWFREIRANYWIFHYETLAMDKWAWNTAWTAVYIKNSTEHLGFRAQRYLLLPDGSKRQILEIKFGFRLASVYWKCNAFFFTIHRGLWFMWQSSNTHHRLCTACVKTTRCLAYTQQCLFTVTYNTFVAGIASHKLSASS